VHRKDTFFRNNHGQFQKFRWIFGVRGNKHREGRIGDLVVYLFKKNEQKEIPKKIIKSKF
jgi:hypothetical protein